MTRPVWVDHILPPKPPKTVAVERRDAWLRWTREAAADLHGRPDDQRRKRLAQYLAILGRVIARDLGCAPPPDAARSPARLLFSSSGNISPFADTGTIPTYPGST